MRLESGRYFGQTKLATSVGSATVTISDYSQQEQPWHTHENETFFVNLRGVHLDTLPNGSFEQPVLSIVYHPRSLPHRSSIGPKGTCGMNIELTAKWFDGHQLDVKSLGNGRMVSNPSASFAALFLLNAIHASHAVDGENALVEFVSLVSEDCPLQDGPSWLMKAVTYCEAQCPAPSTTTQVASAIGIHPVHLARTFRRSTGKTFCAYLQERRLRRAASLMLQGMSAGSAALEAGFSDQFYMTRSFQRQFGILPRELKKLSKTISA